MLTLSIIVKNEERYLRDCLKSVEEVVDEIVLVDTGSTDKTIAIAKEFNTKVFNYKWNDDFSAARNFALEHSSGDWILYLDADERLQASSKNEILNLTKTNSKAAYYCKVKSIDEVNGRPSVMNYVRLFPNDKSVRFEGRVHEQIEASLIEKNYQIKDSTIVIDHLGYNLSNEELKQKAARNLILLKKEYEKNPSSYIAFQLGQTYGILNDKKNAEQYFLASFEDKNLKPEYLSVGNRYLGINAAEHGDLEKALEYIQKSLVADETQPLSLIVAAKIYFQLNKKDDAKYYCKQAYIMNEEFSSGKRSSYQTILLDEKTILDEGINIAAGLRDKELFEFFYNKLTGYNNQPAKGDSIIAANIFHKLFDDVYINEQEIEKFEVILSDEKQVSVVIGLLENYSHSKSKLLMLEMLSDAFPENTIVLNKYAKCLEQNGKFKKAEELLERSFSLNGSDPSLIFYLVSIYLKNNNIPKIPRLIEISTKMFENDPILMQKIDLLKNKLSGILVENQIKS